MEGLGRRPQHGLRITTRYPASPPTWWGSMRRRGFTLGLRACRAPGRVPALRLQLASRPDNGADPLVTCSHCRSGSWVRSGSLSTACLLPLSGVTPPLLWRRLAHCPRQALCAAVTRAFQLVVAWKQSQRSLLVRASAWTGSSSGFARSPASRWGARSQRSFRCLHRRLLSL